MKFNAGDLVWFTGLGGEEFYHMKGDYPAVVEKVISEGPYEYAITIEGHTSNSHTGHWKTMGKYLRPRKPPAGIIREETGSWDLCPWKPESITIKEQA